MFGFLKRKKKEEVNQIKELEQVPCKMANDSRDEKQRCKNQCSWCEAYLR